MGLPHSPIFGMGAISWPLWNKLQWNWWAEIESPKNTNGDSKLVPISESLFWYHLLTVSKYINPACQVKHGRPIWRERFSNLSQAPFPGLWNHAEVKATSQIASCCSKSFAADTQWKIADMFVRGCSIASMWFNYKDERRLALGTIWCKVNLYFVRSCFILYRILCIWRLHVHGDQTTMNISICIFSAVLARLCKFYGVANRCIYSAECDGCACRECHIHCRTRWCESCHWQWYLLERIEFGRALSERSWFSILEISELMYSTPTCPWWLDHHAPANTWCCFCVGTHAISLGVTAAGGQRNVGITTKLSDVAVNLTVLFVCESTQFL